MLGSATPPWVRVHAMCIIHLMCMVYIIKACRTSSTIYFCMDQQLHSDSFVRRITIVVPYKNKQLSKCDKTTFFFAHAT